MLGRHVEFSDAITRTHDKIVATQIEGFAVPHIVVDDVLSPGMVERVNANWPGPKAFGPEMPGNFIFHMYQRDYGKMSDAEREFWVPFNEQFWPAMIASCAQVFSPILKVVFDDLSEQHFGLDWPLTLAQGTPEYRGVNVHTHFWHAPHWAFTVLLYIDPADTLSSGTALHRIGGRSGESNYALDDLDETVMIAMDQLRWEELGRQSPMNIISYKPNRLFVMLDGPLAIHSVRSGPESTRKAISNGRRRVLRCHAKVHHAPFYDEHARRLGVPFGPHEYTRLMDWGAKLEGDDLKFRDTVIRRFYRERIASYAQACAALSRPGGTIGSDVFLRQARERVP